MRHILRRNEISYFAVRVAGNILQGSRPVRFFLQALDRHNGEYLVYRPGVRQGLEKRKVTEVFIRQQLGKPAEFVGRMLQPAGNLIYLAHDRPVQTLYLGTGL